MTPPLGSARAGLVSQVDAIPNSATHQYKVSDDSNTTITDSVGSINATTTSTSVIESDSQLVDGFRLGFNNNPSDTMELNSVPSEIDVAGNTGKQFTVAVTIDYSTYSGDGEIFYYGDGTDFIALGRDVGNSNDDLSMQIVYNSGTSFKASVSSISQTGLIRVAYAVDTVNDSGDIYVNGVDETDGSNGVSTNFYNKNPIFNFGFAPADADIDNPIIYNGLLSSNEATADYNAQPW